MKFFTAKEAKALAAKRTIPAYLEDILENIKYSSIRGKCYYELTANHYKLSEEDYQFLEILGYKVQREEHKTFNNQGWLNLGIVSW